MFFRKIMDNKLNEFIFKINRPCIFKNILEHDENSNSATKWDIEYLANMLKDEKITFRLGKKASHKNCNYINVYFKGSLCNKNFVIMVKFHGPNFV